MADFLCEDFNEDDFDTNCAEPSPSQGDNRIGGTGAIRRSPTPHRAARFMRLLLRKLAPAHG